MDISVCIVNWNTRELLFECLSSLMDDLELESCAAEIVVVDNASTDGSQEMVAAEFPSTVLLCNTENVGFGTANNQAIRESSGTYVLLLNSDTHVNRHMVSVLMNFLDTHRSCGAVGPMVVGSNGDLQLSAARFPRLRHALFGGVLSNQIWRRLFPQRPFFAELGLTPQEHSSVQDADWLLGCCILVRRSAIEAVGLFDEGIFMFYEEADLCYRLKRAGWSIVYTPHTTVVHYGGGSYREVWGLGEQVGRQLAGLEYFHRKHYGRLDLAALRALNCAGSAMKALVFGLAALWPSNRSATLLRDKARWHRASLRYYVTLALPGRAARDFSSIAPHRSRP